MSKHIGCVQDQGWIDITIPPEMTEEFKVLVRRATNTWQDMSPEMRDFADRVLGVDKIMGQNMKEGHSSNVRNFELYDIKFIEDKNLGPEEFKVQYLNKPIATRSCCGTLLREPHHTQCTQLSKILKTVLCDGHPETCNCPKHCR